MTVPHPGEEDRIAHPEGHRAARPAARRAFAARTGESGMFRLVSAVLMIALAAPVVGIVAEATAVSGADLASAERPAEPPAAASAVAPGLSSRSRR